jgi:hypothetical protein
MDIPRGAYGSPGTGAGYQIFSSPEPDMTYLNRILNFVNLLQEDFLKIFRTHHIVQASTSSDPIAEIGQSP